MKYSYYKDMVLPMVRRANNLTAHEKEKRLRFWHEHSKKCFEEGFFDMAYEYIAMIELSLCLAWPKNDRLRLSVWKMFVRDYRLGFSAYEYKKFQLLTK